jgi:cation:H+ antiporter
VGYMAISVRWAKQHSFGEPFVVPDELAAQVPMGPMTEAEEQRRGIGNILLFMVIGLLLVIFASHVLINSVRVMAVQAGVPQVVISATLVALGTSLPELIVAITSIRRGHPELLVGNVIGADILNVLFVTGAAALAAPLPIVEVRPDPIEARIFLYLHLPTMLLALLLFRVFIFSAVRRGQFKRWFGYPLLLIYVGFVLIQLKIAGPGVLGH